MSTPVKGYISASLTSPGDWKYVSEGGATIVFSYRGPPHPVFSGTVLRLRKARHELNIAVPWQPDSKPASESVIAEGVEQEEPDDPSISFQQKVASQLIEPAFLPRLEPVLVERSWLEGLRDSSEKDRPLERRSNDDIDVTRRKGVLATDLVGGGDGWAVEIKVCV